MLLMCPASDQRNLHIRKCRPCQNTPVSSCGKLGQNRSLKAFCQDIRRTRRLENKAASCFSRFQKKMHLRIMAKRLEMPDALHSIRNRLFIDNARSSIGDRKTQPFFHKAGENLPLHLTHHADGNLSRLFGIGHRKRRFLLFQNGKLPIRLKGIRSIRQNKLPGKNRRKHAFNPLLFCTDSFAGSRFRKSHDRTDGSGRCFLYGRETASRIQADSGDLLLSDHLADKESPSRHTKKRLPLSESIPPNLDHASRKL